jgi:integrase
MVEINEAQAGQLLELLKGAAKKNPIIKVSELRERFLREKGRLSRKTLNNYRWAFDRLEKYSENWVTSPAQVNEFLGSLTDLGDESVLLIFKMLRVVGRYCKETYGWNDATEGASRTKVSHKQRRYLRESELRAVVEACQTVSDKALILSLLDSSARIGELASLLVNDLGDSSFVVRRGKTGQRHYRCDDRVIQLMREAAVDGVVFYAQNTHREIIRPVRPCAPDILGGRVRAIMVRAGLSGEKLGPHTLRHTAASLVAKGTKSALAVKALLQHDDIATSMLYIHDVEDAIQQEISPMELSGVKIGSENQLALGEPERLALTSGGGVALAVADLIEDLFKPVPDGVSVRPKLGSEDLRLIQYGLKELMRVRNESGSGSRCVQLMRRMMRRV